MEGCNFANLKKWTFDNGFDHSNALEYFSFWGG